MYCPNSECPDRVRFGVIGEYGDDVKVCPKCGSPLLPGGPPQEPEEHTFTLARDDVGASSGSDLTPVMEFSNRHNADLARAYLEANGIHAHVSGDDCGSVRPELAFGRGVILLAAHEDVPGARALLEAKPPEGASSD